MGDKMARHVRANFTDKQKAEIFVRDRGICGFSGKSLWVLDYGVCPTFDYDWPDHIKPSRKGGKADIINGICSSSFFNAKKKDNGSDNKYFWKEGRPTPDYFAHYGTVDKVIWSNISRFSNLKISDWYFNRAMADVYWGVSWLYWKHYRVKYTRDVNYYSKAAWKMLEKCRRLDKNLTIAGLRERQLTPVLAGKDQKIMLTLVEALRIKDIEEVVHALFPFALNSWDLFGEFTEVKTTEEARVLLKKVNENQYVSSLTAEIIRANSKILYGI